MKSQLKIDNIRPNNLRRYILALAVFIFFVASLSAQESDSSLAGSEAENDATLEEQIPSLSEAKSERKKITALDIKGNKTIATSVILSKIKTRISQEYSPNISRDDIKRLYDTGFFAAIKVELEDFSGGVRVTFILKEKPIIEKVSFKGFRAVGLEKIRSVIASKQGQYLDYPKLKQDAKEIKALYEKKGFSAVSIEPSVTLDDAQEKANIEFVVNEGKRNRIMKIIALGVLSFKEKRILKLMKTKKRGFLSSGLLKEDILEEDIERIKSFYRSKGFIEVAVDKEVVRDTETGNIYITITVDEGRQYRVGSILINGNEKISADDLKSRIKMIEGEIYIEADLYSDKVSIQECYLEKGYLFARVEASTSLSSDSGLMNITYNIVENELAYVNRIEIRGNIKTKDKVIRRELRIYPGERFDGKKIERSGQRLDNLGFFQPRNEGGVTFDIQDTDIDQPNRKDLIVEVKEAKTGEFSFGGGYSSVDNLIGFMEIAQKNFDFKNFQTFTGAGQDLRLKAQLGSLSSSFELSFTEPWIFDYPLSFGFDAYNTGHKRESDVGYGYDESRAGGDLRLGKELNEFLRANLVYRIENVEIGNIPSEATSDLKQEEGVNLISSVGLSLTRDSRDNIFNPTKGIVLGGTLEIAGGPFAGDKDFYRFSTYGIYDRPVFKAGKARRKEEDKYSVLEFRGRLGIINEYGVSDNVPIYERFYLGGSNSVRGYNERKIGPIDIVTEDPLGGEAMLLGNMEYTYPFFDFIKGAAFYDVGNVWANSGDLGRGGFKAGAGLGIRIKTPLGPVKLDYGIPLNDEPGEDEKSGKFHFSISRGF